MKIRTRSRLSFRLFIFVVFIIKPCSNLSYKSLLDSMLVRLCISVLSGFLLKRRFILLAQQLIVDGKIELSRRFLKNRFFLYKKRSKGIGLSIYIAQSRFCELKSAVCLSYLLRHIRPSAPVS